MIWITAILWVLTIVFFFLIGTSGPQTKDDAFNIFLTFGILALLFTIITVSVWHRL